MTFTSFHDLDKLKQFLKQDSKVVSLNPVRFINVDSMAMWVEVRNYLLTLADESTYLSNFCEDNDTTPNINRVISSLKKSEKNQLIAPLSEYLRIIPDQAENIINKFVKAEYQNNDSGRLRVYFLMYRMKSLLKTLTFDDPRTKDCLVFLETDEESDYKLTIIQKELDVKLNGNEIEGFKNYLKYWEANPDKPIILHTNNAIHFEKNHFFDNVYVIVSSYDLIKYRYGLPNGVLEENGVAVEWNGLAKLIVKEGGFDEACCSAFSINKYSIKLFSQWNALSPFLKWLLWLWTRVQPTKSYLTDCAKDCDSVSDFVNAIYCSICKQIKENTFNQAYIERYELLKNMGVVPTDLYWHELNALSSLDALRCLTNLTDIERKAIFEIVAQYDYKEKDAVLRILINVYPQLYHYLHNDLQYNSANLSQEQYQYFDEYKWLKATDSITADFVAKVQRIASEKGESVFCMQTRNECVKKYYNDNTSILFVDGMGVEYVDYLAYVFSNIDEQTYSVSFESGYCNLPSITEINKDFMVGRKTIEPPVRELDELKHANNVHPESLIKQFSILDELKTRVLGLLVGDTKRIILAADHGTSRLAVRIRNTEWDNVYSKPEGVNIYKYGRFCEGTKDEPNYPSAINYNDKLIFADYSRFIQSGAPIDEIHGGASLEEWIVPIITISRLEQVEEKLIISPEKSLYRPELGTKQVYVRFSISGGKRDAVMVKVNGVNYKCKFVNGLYEFSFVPNKDDKTLSVRVFDNGLLGQFDIAIEQGIQKNTKFDI